MIIDLIAEERAKGRVRKRGAKTVVCPVLFAEVMVAPAIEFDAAPFSCSHFFRNASNREISALRSLGISVSRYSSII